MRPVRTVARAMLASIFVIDGLRTLARPESRVEAVRPFTDRMTPLIERADPRLPTDARSLIRIKAVTDVMAGLALATGRLARPAAAVLAAGLVPHALTGPSGFDQRLRDLGLLGGLLLATVDTAGRPGLHYRTTHAIDRSQRSVRRAVRTARREAKIVAASAAAARRLPG